MRLILLTELQVPYLDASADHLVWQLDAPLEAALATRRVDVSWCAIELRLLGASHQVVLWSHEEEAIVCSELVACRPGAGGDLPASVSAKRGGVHYRFTSNVEDVASEELSVRASAIVHRLGRDDRSLVGSFPGSPHAITGIEVVPQGWRTWHVYPQTGQIVTTATAVQRSPRGCST